MQKGTVHTEVFSSTEAIHVGRTEPRPFLETSFAYPFVAFDQIARDQAATSKVFPERLKLSFLLGQVEPMPGTPKQQVKHYLRTGESDAMSYGWPGENWLVQAKAESRTKKAALTEEVRRRSIGLPLPTIPVIDHHSFTYAKVAPMVNGLFPASERENVLTMLEKSVVFLTADNIYELLQEATLHTSWTLANLYLTSIGAELLGGKGKEILGLSEETTCYVTHHYFSQTDRFDDYLVHEAAHVFHNCKRMTVGLPETRTKEFLLNIEYCERETFAYACEVYSRILELAENRNDRIKLAEEAIKEFTPPDHKVNMAKFHNALLLAASARNGWSKILEVCAQKKLVKTYSR